MCQIVKYQNELNRYPIFKLTDIEQDLFMALLSKTSFSDNQWIETNLYDLLDEIDYSRTSVISIEEKVDSMIDKLCSPKIRLKTGSTVRLFVCFDELEYDEITHHLKLHLQDTFFETIKNYRLGFTRFELAEFVTLSGSYTKTLYRLLKQYRSKGSWQVSIEDFKKLLNVPENYRQCDIDTRVLKPAIKQLSKEHDLFDTVRIPFKNLKVEKLKKAGRGARGRGGVITALKFTFDAEKIKEVPEEKKTITSAAPKAAKPAQIPTAQAVKSPFKAEE